MLRLGLWSRWFSLPPQRLLPKLQLLSFSRYPIGVFISRKSFPNSAFRRWNHQKSWTYWFFRWKFRKTHLRVTLNQISYESRGAQKSHQKQKEKNSETEPLPQLPEAFKLYDETNLVSSPSVGKFSQSSSPCSQTLAYLQIKWFEHQKESPFYFQLV